MGGNHAVDGEKGERRGRVDENVIVIIGDASKGVF